jgi:hypothetical protein
MRPIRETPERGTGMNLPILGKLKDGVKFDFDTLADNFDAVEAFWEWWWENRDLNIIDRPEIIADDDPILEATQGKKTADLLSYSDFFSDFLINAIASSKLTAGQCLLRGPFRDQVARIVGSNSVELPDGPQLIFAGGGYGSGKTTMLGHLAQCGKLPLKMCHMVGVDYCKLYMPEFNLIQGISDGRASVTVQSECKNLGSNLFMKLVQDRKSFIWDSSMSDEKETRDRIALARDQGYRMSMIAVLTPLEIATRQAMKRARETRRFPHKDALPQSHTGFRKALMGYIPAFDNVTVFANLGEQADVPEVIAERIDGKELAILNDELFNRLSSVPTEKENK